MDAFVQEGLLGRARLCQCEGCIRPHTDRVLVGLNERVVLLEGTLEERQNKLKIELIKFMLLLKLTSI